MCRFLLCPLVLLALVVPARADEDTDDKKVVTTASPGEQYQALLKEFSEGSRNFSLEYRKAKTQAERQKVVQELYPQPEKFVGRFMEIAKQNAEDPAALDALVWVVTNAGYGSEANQAIDILTQHHIESPKLARVCQRLMYNGSPGAQKLLRSALEQSPHKDVQGWACYSLAKAMMRSNRGGQEKGDQSGEAEKLLERVAQDFAEVSSYRGTLADMAKADLFELRHLAIGCVAPDIEGEDIDGVHFKLSDYRGKVVVLDFWGNW